MLPAAVRQAFPFLAELGIEAVNAGCFDGEGWKASGQTVDVISPINGKPIGVKIIRATPEDAKRCIDNMMKAKKEWMSTPAPKRGEIVRQIGDELRKHVSALGQLLSLEVGKILPEGKGEVQEFIDMCDFATGLSRQLPGQVFPSERPGHFMMEQWHPLGGMGVVCAFNFPVAVAGWNSCISLVCGNTQIWKPASTTMLVSLATHKIMTKVFVRNGINPAVSTFVAGPAAAGDVIIDSPHIGIVSFTGSTPIGRGLAERIARRFGRSIMELGGNNALIVNEDANVEMALRSVLFAAVGTCGQRCTTCRRLIVHEKLWDTFIPRLTAIYRSLKIGNPLHEGVLVGPLHTLSAVKEFEDTIVKATKQGGKILVGGKAFHNDPAVPGPHYVQPTIIEISPKAECVQEEAFVPILYAMKFSTIEEAIELNNGVPQGLSASLFTNNLQAQQKWTGPCGSDTGIANVNVPTNGAEIGGAFGGEKETGGGREAGSDAWKQYMRRLTTTINYSNSMPLAQGINFNPK